MKLSDYRETYQEFSGKASDVARHLAFAGIALIWIFKQGGTPPKVPQELLFPTVCLAIALASDLLQYSIAAGIWGLFHWHKERKGVSEGTELLAPRYLNWPALFFFCIKLIAVVCAYWLICNYIWMLWFLDNTGGTVL